MCGARRTDYSRYDRLARVCLSPPFYKGICRRETRPKAVAAPTNRTKLEPRELPPQLTTVSLINERSPDFRTVVEAREMGKIRVEPPALKVRIEIGYPDA
jgi:hypothetical protein